MPPPCSKDEVEQHARTDITRTARRARLEVLCDRQWSVFFRLRSAPIAVEYRLGAPGCQCTSWLARVGRWLPRGAPRTLGEVTRRNDWRKAWYMPMNRPRKVSRARHNTTALRQLVCWLGDNWSRAVWTQFVRRSAPPPRPRLSSADGRWCTAMPPAFHQPAEDGTLVLRLRALANKAWLALLAWRGMVFVRCRSEKRSTWTCITLSLI